MSVPQRPHIPAQADTPQQLPLSFAWHDEAPLEAPVLDDAPVSPVKRRRGRQPGTVQHCGTCHRIGHTSGWHDHWEHAVALYAEGVSTHELPARIGVNRTTIFRWLGKSGVPRRNARPMVRIGPASTPEKYCPKCGEWLSFKEFASHPKGHQGVNPWCIACGQLRSAAYTATHQVQQFTRNRAYRDDLRQRVLLHYSNGRMCCACCSEQSIEFLAVDHIDGGGNQHRRMLAQKGMGFGGFYKWLEMNNYPRGYRVLCHNCNFARAVYGECPHMRKHSPKLTDSLGTSD